MIIDTHCHFDMMTSPERYIQKQEGVGNVVIGMTNLPSHFELGAPYIKTYKNIRLALGFHPLLAAENRKEISKFQKCIEQTSYIGEIGLDFSREGIVTKNVQISVLRNLLESLKGMKKIISVHSRKAEVMLFDLLTEYNIENVIFSSGIGGLGTIQNECTRGLNKGFDRVSPHFIPMSISNMAAGHIAIKYGLNGMCTCVVTACASGTNAIGDAFRQIRDGYHDVMVCGGSEASITELGIGGFTSMKALSESKDPNRASIPFDKERNGFVMGEGAGVLVLEDYDHAVARGAKIYCEIVGYGATCDANHVTAPLADGSMAAKAMTKAMEDGKVDPSSVNYINAHGTSTSLNDKGETKAIKLAFGENADKLMVSSTKSMTGHLLGASGAVEAIITALSVHNDIVPPTINYQVPDEECDLDIVPNKMREVTVNYAMSNSLGFGGHNASIVFKKWSK